MSNVPNRSGRTRSILRPARYTILQSRMILRRVGGVICWSSGVVGARSIEVMSGNDAEECGLLGDGEYPVPVEFHDCAMRSRFHALDNLLGFVR